MPQNQKKQHSKKIRNHGAEELIVKAARKLFFKKGIGAVSTDMLAKEARVSKATMYNRFTDKADILKAVVKAECAKFFHTQSELPQTRQEYIDVLIQMGIDNINFINAPDVLHFDKLVLSQVLEHQEVTALFFQNAHEATYKHLEHIIQHGQTKGFISQDFSAGLLANMILHSWKDVNHQRKLYGIKPTEKIDAKTHARAVLEIILGFN